MTYLEDILGLSTSGQWGRKVDNGGDTLECVGEISLDKVIDNDDVDLVAVLGIHLPECVGLSRPHDSDEALITAIGMW